MQIVVNTDSYRIDQSSGVLVDFLRKKQHLVGTKIGCREGDCGACTVIIGEKTNNGIMYKPIVSCLMPMANVVNKHIITIEGLNLDKDLTLIQSKFVEHNATQCGFCTPGFILSVTAYLLNDNISVNGALTAIDGNICRCTGYLSIIRAVESIIKILLQAGINSTAGKSRIEFLIENKVLPPTFMNSYLQLTALPQNTVSNFNTPKNFSLILAGGTDLNVQIPEKIDKLIELDNVFSIPDELRFISKNESIIEIGAATTFNDLCNSSLIQEIIPEINKYSKYIASTQIRNMATIGGNIANASPIADIVILLLAFNPKIKLLNMKQFGFRELYLHEFYKGYKQLDKHADEIIYSLIIENKTDRQVNFEKVAKREILDIASVNTAASVIIKNNVIVDIVISAGGVAPVPTLLKTVMNNLIDKKLTAETVATAINKLDSDINPISDVRGSSRYKKLLLRNLLHAHFHKLFAMDTIEVIQYA